MYDLPKKQSTSSSNSSNASAVNAWLSNADQAADRFSKEFAYNWFPTTAAVNSGNKYATGQGMDGTKADNWDYALGWLDLLPEGAEIKLGLKYTAASAFKFIIAKKIAKKLPMGMPSVKMLSLIGRIFLRTILNGERLPNKVK